MYHIASLMISIIFILLFSACFADKTQHITQIENEIQKDQNNALLHIQLAQEYFNMSIETNNNYTLRKALEEASLALELEPTDLKIQNIYYIIAYKMLLKSSDKLLLSKLKKLFPTLSEANLNVAPPSYIESLFLKYPSDKKQLYKLLKQALRENSSYPYTYIDLAYCYEKDNKYLFAEDILKRGLKLNIAAKEFNAYLLEIYFLQSDYIEAHNGCAIQNKDLSKKILYEAKKLLKIDPDNIAAKDALSLIYTRLGRFNMALASSERDYKVHDTIEYKNIYADNLIKLGKKEDFFSQGFHQDKTIRDDLVALAYFTNENWQASEVHLKRYIKNNRIENFYKYLFLAELQAKLGHKEEAKKTLTSLPKYVKLNQWHKKLKNYFLNKVTEVDLNRSANNACKKTEAYFLIGFKHFINNDTDTAKEFFKKVLDENIFSYVEYSQSQYFLNNM